MSNPQTKHFNQSAAKPSPKDVTVPISTRVTIAERDRIRGLANGMSMSVYLRTVALKGTRGVVRKKSKPSADKKMLGRVLGALGQSRLSSNMNQIAKAAHMGALPVSDDLHDELMKACANIRAMRRDLISALGVQVED